MLQKSTFLILGLLCTAALIQTQEVLDESTETDLSTKIEESSKCEETQQNVVVNSLPTCRQPDQNAITENRNYEASGDTEYAELPWLVSLSEEIELEVYSYVCAGALISPTAVVTTAHCVQRFVNHSKSLVIKAGIWKSALPNDTFPIQMRYAKRIVILDHFERGYHMNDIAVVVMDKPIDFKFYIQPIRLPLVTDTFVSHSCWLNYWNIINGDVTARKFHIVVINDTMCNANLIKRKLTRDVPVHESTICAISQSNNGDYEKQLGAPLICEKPKMNGQYYLAGLNSIGYDLGNHTYLGLFVNVAHLRRWIVSMDV